MLFSFHFIEMAWPVISNKSINMKTVGYAVSVARLTVTTLVCIVISFYCINRAVSYVAIVGVTLPVTID